MLKSLRISFKVKRLAIIPSEFISEGFETIDTHKINMKRISKNIAIALLGIMVWTLSKETYAQCKADNSSPVKGEFEISGVKIKGDGGLLSTASNNIPIKICEGELINLKSTLPIYSLSNVNYWIIPLNNYNSLASPPSSFSSAADGYTTLNGDVDIKMIDKSTSNPQGFSAYSTAGKYVITQYDNSDSKAGGPGRHHACQVIEIIKATTPDVQFNTCSGGQVITKFLSTANNNYENYNIKYILPTGFQPFDTTGKIATYPFDFKNVSNLSGYSSVKIEVKGVTKTGGCPAPASPLQTISLNSAVVNPLTLTSIVGTTLKGEFKLAVTADNGIKRNVYMRDPSINNFFDYTAPFKSYTSSATSGVDSNFVQVPDGSKVYCFQTEAIDGSCASSFVSNPALRSNELCTTLIDVKAENNKNVITWSQALGGGLINANFVNYIIEKYRPDGSLDKILNSTPKANETSFTDSDVTCGLEYAYKVTTRYPLKSISQFVKVKAISNTIPPKLDFVFVNVQDDKLRIQNFFPVGQTPLNIPLNSYKYYKSNTYNGAYSLANTGNSFFDDTNVDVSKQSYCYYMSWVNLCNVESSPSDKICSVYLKADGANLKWTSQSPITANIDSYKVIRVKPNSPNPASDLFPLELGATINNYDTNIIKEDQGQEIFVRIEARPVGYSATTSSVLNTPTSNTVRLFRPSFSLIPQIFTPNGDGFNDKFIVKGMFIKNLKMSIYDRWGNVIYYNEETNYPYIKQQNDNESLLVGWNGIMNNGIRAIEGSYAYKIEIEDTIGQITSKEGALLLAY